VVISTSWLAAGWPLLHDATRTVSAMLKTHIANIMKSMLHSDAKLGPATMAEGL
jgi:hypothetical protein